MGDHPEDAAGERRDCDNKVPMWTSDGEVNDAACTAAFVDDDSSIAASSELSLRRPRPGNGDRPEGPEDIVFVVRNKVGVWQCDKQWRQRTKQVHHHAAFDRQGDFLRTKGRRA